MTETKNNREQRFTETVQRIVNELDASDGGSHFWIYERPQTHFAVATRQDDGLQVRFGLDAWRDRIRVSPRVPTLPEESGRTLHSWGVVGYDTTEIQTYIGLDRPAHQAASQIQRKVVEPYAPLLPRILLKRREYLKLREETEQLALYIASKVGADIRSNRIREGGTAYISVPDLTFPTLEIRDGGYVYMQGAIDPQIARHLAGLLADLQKGEKPASKRDQPRVKRKTRPTRKAKTNGKKPPQTAPSASA